MGEPKKLKLRDLEDPEFYERERKKLQDKFWEKLLHDESKDRFFKKILVVAWNASIANLPVMRDQLPRASEVVVPGEPIAPIAVATAREAASPGSVEKTLKDGLRRGVEEGEERKFKDLSERWERSTDPAERKQLEKEMAARVVLGRN